MITTSSDECSAIAFYGIAPGVRTLEGVYQAVARWFEGVGYRPDRAAVGTPGLKPRWTTLRGAERKLKGLSDRSVASFELVSLLPGARIPQNDYFLVASASLKYSYVDLVCRSSIARLSRAALLPIASQIAETVEPAYGIGFCRPHHLGPPMYAIGIVQGLGLPSQRTAAEDAEASSISHWGDGVFARVWEKGLLRDVYPWNFLMAAQLEAQVEGTPLKRWIAANEARGQLEPFVGGLWFWELANDHIPAVRQALERADLIFDWKKHVLSGKIQVT
jgi:hypothetical protein